jgi:hypothetical protein
MPVLKNPRHEAFAQALAKGHTSDEAYKTAGFKANRGNASTLKAKQNISDRVAELQGRAAAKTVVTIEDIARQLDEDRQFAREVGSAAASVAATMGKAKVLGLIVDKNEHTGKDGAPIEVARIERVIVRPANPDPGGI